MAYNQQWNDQYSNPIPKKIEVRQKGPHGDTTNLNEFQTENENPGIIKSKRRLNPGITPMVTYAPTHFGCFWFRVLEAVSISSFIQNIIKLKLKNIF